MKGIYMEIMDLFNLCRNMVAEYFKRYINTKNLTADDVSLKNYYDTDDEIIVTLCIDNTDNKEYEVIYSKNSKKIKSKIYN